MSTTTTKYMGGCHCGAVRFEVEADLSQGVGRCNCTVCTKVSGTTMIVKPAAFKLVKGEADLSFYEWGAKIGQRYFCKHCGVSCFGKGHLKEVGGDYVSVYVNAFDEMELIGLKVSYWDGRNNNWESGPRETPWPIKQKAM